LIRAISEKSDIKNIQDFLHIVPLYKIAKLYLKVIKIEKNKIAKFIKINKRSQ